MSRTWFFSLAALAGVASSAGAQVVVQVPYVMVRTSRQGGVFVQAPFVTVQTGPRVVCEGSPVVLRQPTSEVVPLPRKEPVPPPPPPPEVVPARPPTLKEFAATFGTYDAEILHPATKQPVRFTFTLPPGELVRTRVGPKQITFVYKQHRQDVSIRFLHDGRVQVTN